MFKKVLFTILCLFTLVITNKELVVYADSVTNMYYQYAEPSVNGEDGYIVLYYHHLPSDTYAGVVYSWDITTATNSTFTPYVYATLSSDTMDISFNSIEDSVVNVTAFLGTSQSDSYFSYYQHFRAIYDDDGYSLKYKPGADYDLVGYQAYGNIYVSSNQDFSYSGKAFYNIWGSDNETIQTINRLYDLIYSMDSNYSNWLMEISDNTWNAEALLQELWLFICNELGVNVENIDNDLDTIIELLEKYEQMEGEESTESLDKGEVNDYNDKEDSITSKGQDADNVTSDVSVEVDSDTNNFIWNTLNRLINSSPVVFKFVLTMLSLGSVSLILNR